jgi:hypothetical protein
MSTGAWIFVTAALVLAVAAPVSYAAATSTVAIGNTTNGSTAFVDSERQLVTVNGVQPFQVVHQLNLVSAGCQSIYTPPAGKALMITSVNYDIGSGASGTESYLAITDASCGTYYDIADTTQAYDVQRANFSPGLPVPSVGVYGFGNGSDLVDITGYLIPAGQLPPNPPALHVPKGLKKLRFANR